jgi:excisionase family DNA binding protein
MRSRIGGTWGGDGKTPATSGSLEQQPRWQAKPESWRARHGWLREMAERGPVEKLLLTPSEAADVLSISRSKLYELIGQGRVSTVTIDTSRRVPAHALVEFMQRLQEQDADHQV